MKLRILNGIAGAEKQQTFAWQSISTCASRLLIIAFDVFRQIVVNDEAHVRFVDAHAEGDGGANHADFVANEEFLIGRARLRIEACVIRRGFDPVRAQTRRDILRAISALAVNDSAITWPHLHKTQELFVGTVFA